MRLVRGSVWNLFLVTAIISGSLGLLEAQFSEWVWAKKAGGYSDCMGNSIAVDSNGNSYIIGGFEGDAHFGTIVLRSSGMSDIFVAKLDENGNYLWARRAGGASVCRGNGITIDSDGNSYVTGIFTGTARFGETVLQSMGVGIYDLFVAKIDENGNWVWAQRAGSSRVDGEYICGGFTITVGNDGNSYVIGSFTGRALFGETELLSAGSFDIFIAKLDTEGNWLWAKRAGGSRWCTGAGIDVDREGNIYVTGWFNGFVSFGTILMSSLGSENSFVAKLDTEGNWLWVIRAGGRNTCRGNSIAIDDDGNSYLTGYFSGSATFGDTELQSEGGNDIFVAKLNENGNWLWAKRAGGTGYCSALSIKIDSNGAAYVTGYIEGTAHFGGIELQSAGQGDLFVAKVDNNGNWVWVDRAGERGFCRGNGIAVDSDGNGYVTGRFFGEATFGDTELQSVLYHDIFVAKITFYPYPAEPINAHPANAAINVSLDLDRLQWEYLSNPTYKDPLGFRVYFNETGDFSEEDDFYWIPYVEEQENYAVFDILPEHLEYSTRYYWMVVSTTKLNGTGEGVDAIRCPVWSFITELYPRPVAATNPYPIEDSVDVALNLEDLRWDFIIDTTRVNPTGFRVYFHDSDEFGGDDFFYWVPYSQGQERYATSDAVLERLAYSIQYYWKVVPTTKVNGIGEGTDADDCPVWSFITELNPHLISAVNPYPAEDSVGVVLGLEELRWGYLIDTTRIKPAGFRVYFNETGDFSEDDDFYWIPYVEDEDRYTISEILPERLNHFTGYYWQVVPTTKVNGTGEGVDAEDCPVWSFITELNPRPDSAVNPYPAVDSTGVVLDLKELRWDYIIDRTRVNPTGFRVYFNDTGEFGEDDVFLWIPDIEAQEEYAASEILPGRLECNTGYYWKVVPTTKTDGIGDGIDARNVPVWTFFTEIETSANNENSPFLTELKNNYPNPFNPQTLIEFSIKKDTEAMISIYNIRGQLVKELYHGSIKAGKHSLIWNGEDNHRTKVGSGVYYYRLKTGDYDQVKKMLLVK